MVFATKINNISTGSFPTKNLLLNPMRPVVRPPRAVPTDAHKTFVKIVSRFN